jgi:lysophospholipase L1-like esterase
MKITFNEKMFRKKTLYIFYLILTVIILLEVLLRIFNPFHFRIKGNQIILETNKTYHFDNSRIPVLDKSVTHTKNGLGFRGPEKPADFTGKTTIITVGGSATECAYLNDGKTWSDVLYKHLRDSIHDVWLNNAGFAGHSSYGHIALLKDHIIALHPKYVLILSGANDIRRGKAPNEDSFFSFLSRNSELVNVLVNLARTREAKEKNLTDNYLDLKHTDTLNLTDSFISDRLKNEKEWVDRYTTRLDTLIELCIRNNIQPVLITQPSLVGTGNDPVTDASLENVKLKNNENGKLWWTMLEKYNDGTRKIAQKRNVPLIDLAHLLPKSSAYFYDIVHFTNEGAAITGKIIYDSLLHTLRH